MAEAVGPDKWEEPQRGGGDTYLAFTSKLAVTLKSPNVDNFAFREPPQPRRHAVSPHGDDPGWQLLPPCLHDVRSTGLAV